MSIHRNELIHEYVEKYTYPGYHAHDSWCHLGIIGTAKLVLVVMTEAADNPGTSITNRSEHIASLIVNENGYDLIPGHCIFVEHYQPRPHGLKLPEYRIVTYDWRGRTASTPEWTDLTVEQFEALQNMIDKS